MALGGFWCSATQEKQVTDDQYSEENFADAYNLRRRLQHFPQEWHSGDAERLLTTLDAIRRTLPDMLSASLCSTPREQARPG